MASDGFDSQILADDLASLSHRPWANIPGQNNPMAFFDKRKLALGALLSEMTESEITDFRLRLNALPRPNFMMKLPFDLHCKLLELLNLEESMNLRLVCPAWSAMFSRGEFCQKIVHRHLRGNYECYTQGQGAESMGSWLQVVMRCRLQRMRGQFESTSSYGYTRGVTESFSHAPQYCNGKIAYMASKTVLRVRDLRNFDSPENLVQLPQRQLFGNLWLLSDEFIVVISTSESIIYARSCGGSGPYFIGEPQIRKLESAVLKLSVRGKRVGLVLSNGEIRIWKIGSAQNSVELVIQPPFEPKLSNRRDIVLIFHPVKQDTFYICTETIIPGEKPKSCVRIYEFEGLSVKSRYTAYLNSNRWSMNPTPTIVALHDDVIGITNLTGFRKHLRTRDDKTFDNQRSQEGFYELDTIDVFDVRDQLRKDTDTERSFLEFDMHTKLFSCHNYHQPVIIDSLEDTTNGKTLIWRNQTLIPDVFSEPSTGSKTHKPPFPQMNKSQCFDASSESMRLIAVNHAPRRVDDKIYWHYKVMGSNVAAPQPPTDIERKLLVAFYWLGDANMDLFQQHSEIGTLLGDDDFVVMFLQSQFVVWCFDPSVHLGRR
ncbi:uncharacterized protein RCO7_01631 [Rhynchosporium graminicola]|uniref:F-box domain-containing protein n=1 Tax=Rhynchosporium graminicola TaxID=2792576 RepID=A0A1E1KP54_9HELO|nr:uncharacterized protein RCO7_01631 [Rhynchosporium commune]